MAVTDFVYRISGLATYQDGSYAPFEVTHHNSQWGNGQPDAATSLAAFKQLYADKKSIVDTLVALLPGTHTLTPVIIGTPQVNNVAGYSIGAATMTIDGITVAFKAGDTFRVGLTDTQIYTATGTPTLTSVTFTPALKVAATNNEELFPVQSNEVVTDFHMTVTARATYDDGTNEDFAVQYQLGANITLGRVGVETDIKVLNLSAVDALWELITGTARAVTV
jgi:hypothetical protein